MIIEELKYPIGKFEKPKNITETVLSDYIVNIKAFPSKLKMEVYNLSDEQLNTPYRTGGWTIRQVVHHCADSHMNALIRFKLALTENVPTIKPYHQELWAELIDSKELSIEPALMIIEGIHKKWVALLNSLTKSELEKSFFHPEQGKEIKLNEIIALYSWHCNHHLAHITQLKKLKNW